MDAKRLYFIYRGPENGADASVPRNEEYLERHTMYYACKGLGIDMPPEHKGFQDALDRI